MPRFVTRLAALFFSSLLAGFAFAETADLRATLSDLPPLLVDRSATISWTVTIENLGPDAAKNARISAGALSRSDCVNEIVASLAPRERRTYTCSRVVPFNEHSVTVFGSALSQETADPDTTNNLAFQRIIVDTPPDLVVYVAPSAHADRGLPFDFGVQYLNRSLAPVTGAKLTVEVIGAERIVDAPAGCTISGAIATCDLVDFEVDPDSFLRPFIEIRFSAIAPDADGATITIRASIRSDETDADPSNNESSASTLTFRTIFVVNANDAGAGSLRAAIDEVNATCTEWTEMRCKIGFRVPMNGAAWTTIRPETPLPPLTSSITIDGTTQTRLADTNALGPEIELTGDRLTRGNGITLAAPCGSGVQGLVINGFPDNGVYVAAPQCEDVRQHGLHFVGRNYIGTDSAGVRAVPNLRGIFVAADRRDVFAPVFIGGNVISGNRHSGIWVASGSHARINSNIIGLDARKTGPLGNGASGVYVTRGGSGTDLRDNYLGFNGHYGLSMERGTTNVEASVNSFQANGNLAIDYGLDGVSPSIEDPRIAAGNRLYAPQLTGARFDAATDTTIVEGTVELRNEGGCCRSLYVTLYANDVPDESGFGEGQYFLGIAHPDLQGRFRFFFRGRTPGRWIAGTTNSLHLFGIAKSPEPRSLTGDLATATSEFGRTIEVSQ